MQTFAEPGKGRKKCPSCEKYVPAVAKQCPGCDHVFVPKGKVAAKASDPAVTPVLVKVEKPIVRVQRYDQHMIQIGIPAGECPVALRGTSEEELIAWGEKVRAHYLEQNSQIAVEGLIYFTRRNPGISVDINTPLYGVVKELLLNAFSNAPKQSDEAFDEDEGDDE